MKYFKFLVENEINFTRDENGYYIALVKVLNPNFYNEASQSKRADHPKFEDPIEEVSEAKPRSSSQTSRIHTKTITFENKTKTRSRSPATVTKFEKSKVTTYSQPMHNYSEQFGNRYGAFFKTLNPLVGVRGKRINLFQLKYYIDELYSVRFIKDTTNLKSQLSGKGSDLEVKESFPIFVVEFLMNKYVKKHMVDQNALDILLSCEHFRKSNSEIDIFAKFLNEEYDTDDLIFFLFVRSCIEKQLRFTYIEKSQNNIKLKYQDDRDEYIDTEIYLNIKSCINSKCLIYITVANTIFGNEDEILMNSFMEKIEKNIIERKGKQLIRASDILDTTLNDYHQSRVLYKQEGMKV
jgi:hypothetical protein